MFDKSINGDESGNFKCNNGQRPLFETIMVTNPTEPALAPMDQPNWAGSCSNGLVILSKFMITDQSISLAVVNCA
jgi:hypothetical protein